MIKEIYWDFCNEANIEPNIEEDIMKSMEWWLFQASYYEAAESPQWGQEREARAGLATGFVEDLLVPVIMVYGPTKKCIEVMDKMRKVRGGLCDGNWYCRQFDTADKIIEDCIKWNLTSLFDLEVTV